MRPAGCLRVNNGDAVMPPLLAGLGLALLPEFIVGEALADGRLKVVLPDWTVPSGGLYLVTPPGGPKPARIAALSEFLAKHLMQMHWSSTKRK